MSDDADALFARGCALFQPPAPATAPDRTGAAALFAQAADADHIDACWRLARCYRCGEGVLRRDAAEASALARKALRLSDGRCALAHFELGECLRAARDADAARREFAAALQCGLRAQAEAGDAWAQLAVGAMFEDGRGGLARDASEAVRFFRLAADQGNAAAHGGLGRLYQSGAGGLPCSSADAARCYRIAAEQGDAFSELALSALQGAAGRGGLQPSLVESMRLLGSAAMRGEPAALTAMATLCLCGLGSPDAQRNEAAAAQSLREAADQRYEPAQAALGLFYAHGMGGLARDEAEASRLLALGLGCSELVLACPVTDDAAAALVARALAASTTLTRLTLHARDLGPPGVEALLAALRANTVLTRLDLLGVDAASAMAAVRGALAVNTSLTQLHLSSAAPEAAAELVALLDRNRRLRDDRRAMRSALGRCWVRAQRDGDAREPLASLPHELVARIAACMTRDGDASPLDAWSAEERATMWSGVCRSTRARVKRVRRAPIDLT